jgi:hypothetical protein
MSEGKEYATTHGYVEWDEGVVVHCDDPVPPPGPWWRLVGSAADGSARTKTLLFWFWERERNG